MESDSGNDGTFFRVDTEQAPPIYVHAISHNKARAAVAKRGRKVKLVTQVKASSIPPDAVLLDVLTPPGPATETSFIARAAIIRHPYITIAIGVVLGNLLTWGVLIVLAGMFGGISIG